MALCLAACATTSGTKAEGQTGEPVVEKMVVVNNIKFDVAACNLKPVQTALNETIVTAALLSARPAYGECLVDPRQRGSAADTQLTIKATINDSETKFEVNGENLAPTGKACIEKALAALALKPLAKGAKAIEVTMPYAYSAAQGVKWGTNMASDLVGAVRVAQADWCDCYGSLATTPPPGIQAALHASAEKPLQIEMKAAAADQPLASCLEAKLKALTVPKVDRDVTVNYQFLLINGLASQETADAVPTLQFHQLDAIGLGREVDVAMSVGGVELAMADYQETARRYNAKPAATLMKELREKCALLVTRDDGLHGSLDALKQTYERTQKIIEPLKPSDPVWGQIETSVSQRLAATSKELAGTLEQKKSHQAICQKLK